MTETEGTDPQEKCTRQYVLIVVQNAKCRSSRLRAGLYIAELATRNTGRNDWIHE